MPGQLSFAAYSVVVNVKLPTRPSNGQVLFVTPTVCYFVIVLRMPDLWLFERWAR